MRQKFGTLLTLFLLVSLPTQSILATSQFDSSATVEFLEKEIGSGNARILKEYTRLNLNFGGHPITEQMHWHGATLWDYTSLPEITIEDLSITSSWVLTAQHSGLVNRETGHILNASFFLSWPTLTSTSDNLWGLQNRSSVHSATSNIIFGGSEGRHSIFWTDVELEIWTGQIIQSGIYSTTITWNLGITPHQDELSIGAEYEHEEEI